MTITKSSLLWTLAITIMVVGYISRNRNIKIQNTEHFKTVNILLE